MQSRLWSKVFELCCNPNPKCLFMWTQDLPIVICTAVKKQSVVTKKGLDTNETLVLFQWFVKKYPFLYFFLLGRGCLWEIGGGKGSKYILKSVTECFWKGTTKIGCAPCEEKSFLLYFLKSNTNFMNSQPREPRFYNITQIRKSPAGVLISWPHDLLFKVNSLRKYVFKQGLNVY
jgi:hypothetical protein